jgi:hypothetical protein
MDAGLGTSVLEIFEDTLEILTGFRLTGSFRLIDSVLIFDPSTYQTRTPARATMITPPKTTGIFDRCLGMMNFWGGGGTRASEAPSNCRTRFKASLIELMS